MYDGDTINAAEKTIAADQNTVERDYWLNRLSGDWEKTGFPYDQLAPPSAGEPVSREPAAPPEPAQTFHRPLAPALSGRLIKIINGSDRRLHMILTALSAVLLHKYTGSRDIVLGVPIYKQDLDVAFINTELPLRIGFEPGISFKTLVMEVRKTLSEADAHQNYPLDVLIYQLGLSRPQHDFPLYDTVVMLRNIHRREYISLSRPPVLFDFNRRGETIEITVEYNGALYREATVRRLPDHLERLMEQALYQSELPLDRMDILPPEERRRLVEQMNDTAAEYPLDKGVHQLFREQADRTPDRIAAAGDDPLLGPNSFVTYRRLNLRAQRLAALLRRQGVGPETNPVVAVPQDRSILFLEACLGILKAGGAYLPVDPGYPGDRIRFMLRDSSAGIAVTAGPFPGAVPPGLRVIDLLAGESSAAEDRPREHVAGGENLAYVIYTSGTTGKPKGAMITHRGLTNYILWAADTYVKERDIPLHFPLYTSVSFDLTVTTLFTPLVTGNAVVVYGEKDNTRLLEHILEQDRVGVIKTTPSHFRVIGDRSFKVSRLRRFIVGGEELDTPLARKIWDNFEGKVEILNEYGPTETVVGCMIHPFDPGEAGPSVSIGRPAANTGIYVLDPRGLPLPTGVAGEIHIGGRGVARGYANRPELTGANFVRLEIGGQGAEGPSSHLYRTGDLGRWREDGTLDFLGRKDHQVKIRGFRIELGEVESRLAAHPGVKGAAAAVKTGESSGRYLCGYYVSDRPLPVSGLREFLSGTLPEHMIPSYFIRLETIPLTRHGKKDTHALPEPGGSVDTGRPHVPPRNRREKILAEVWRQVLRMDTVGITDNFLELGGDSIKAIQVAARLQKYGLQLDIRDLFQHLTIEKTGHLLKDSRCTCFQGEVTGDVELTPVQRWFFGPGSGGGSHFNHAVMLYREAGFDPGFTGRALETLTRHHDALRMVYVFEETGPRQLNRPVEEPLFTFSVTDLNEKKDYKEAVSQEARQVQQSMDLTEGPLVKSVLFKTPEGDHLLLVIHHLVVDGVSWRILLEDFASAYSGFQQGETVSFPDKTTSFKDWAAALAQYAGDGNGGRWRAGAVEYWKKIDQHPIAPLPKDGAPPQGKRIREDLYRVSVSLTAEETGHLLRGANRAYNTEINDILLTALGLTVSRWSGQRDIAVNLEGHGREEIIAGVDITRTVGWFTAQYPVILSITHPDDLSIQLRLVKESLRQVPDKGVGYGILRYLVPPEDTGMAFSLNPEISFNYLGQLEDDGEDGLFSFSPLSTGDTAAPGSEVPWALNINGIVLGGQLHLDFNTCRHEYRRETVESLAGDFMENLSALVRHCAGKEERVFTPSDYDVRTLTIPRLDFINRHVREQAGEGAAVRKIYPLTPMQQGIWFHCTHEDPRMYFEQYLFQLEGDVEAELMQKALEQLVQRHDAFRTLFIHRGLQQPVQVVVDRRDIALRFEDIALLPEEEKAGFIEDFKREDARRGFRLDADVPLRVSLLRTGDRAFKMLWSFHHIVVDGWCLGIIFDELFRFYLSARDRTPPRMKEGHAYSDYIRWLGKQDPGAAREFWGSYLAGVRRPAVLPARPGAGKGRGEIRTDESYEHLSFALDGALSKDLEALAARAGVTVNILLQCAWGLLLQWYNYSEDAVFGAVVSGRRPEVEGIEEMVGLFINTVPVRIRGKAGTTFLHLIKQVQSETLEARKYDYFPLAEIKSAAPDYTGGKEDIIHHIMAFENYPVDEEVEDLITRRLGFSFTVESTVKMTNYPFYLLAVPAAPLEIRLGYYPAEYDRAVVERVRGHLEHIFARVARDPEQCLGDLVILTEEEQRQILSDFNHTAAEYPRHRSIARLFEEQAATVPDHLAVVSETGVLTYGELNRRADRWAGHLRAGGMSKEDIAVVMLQRSPEMTVALLAVLKAGGAYLPLDPDLPPERLRYIREDSRAAFLLTRRSFVEGNPITREAFIQPCFLDEPPFSGGADAPTAPETPAAGSREDLAYIMFTSGSTGRPKGVMVNQRSVVRLVKNTNFVSFEPGDRIIQTGAPDFDASTLEIWGALLNGLPLHLPGKDDILNVDTLTSVIRKWNITVMWLTSPLFNRLMDLDSRFLEGLRVLLVGGDALSPPHIRRAREAFPGLILVNGYGPTENTTFSTTYRIGESPADLAVPGMSIPIGRPIANSTCFVTDRRGNPVPLGVPGELLVGGDGVARGYLNRPELTAERFVVSGGREKKHQYSYMRPTPKDTNPNWGSRGSLPLALPAQGPPEGRRRQTLAILYRTGDLVRWLPDGNLEFLGRIDRQVKVRGFRVEPAEIEHVLHGHPGVKEAVVDVRKDTGGAAYLAAYYTVKDGGVGDVEPREYLSGRVPGYMVPSFFQLMETFPLTPNGKIDRKGLPEPGASPRLETYCAPVGELEENLVRLWEKVLDIDGIGMEDDFFQRGGHSLKAAALIAAIRKTFQVDFPLADFFGNPTPREQARYIAQARKHSFAAPEPVEKRDYYPTSPAQERLFILRQLDERGTGYHISAAIRLRGPLCVERMEKAFSGLIARHESLRTSFHLVDGHPVQRVHDHVDFDVLYPGPGGGSVFAAIDDFFRPFDLSRAPLLRAGLFREEPDSRVLVIDMHHIISDGVSIGLFIDQFNRLYAGEEPPTPAVQYKDYAVHRRAAGRSEEMAKQEAYWLDRFSGDIPVLNLPTDYPRPEVYCDDGGLIDFEISESLARALYRLAGLHGATIYMVISALYALALSHLSGQPDIIVGTPAAGRNHPDLEPIIGMFVNTLAMRYFPAPGKGFGHFLKEVKQDALEAFENQDYPLDRLVDSLNLPKDTGRHPLMDAFFVLQNMDLPEMEMAGLKVEAHPWRDKTAPSDIGMTCREQAGRIDITLRYAGKLFKPETMERFVSLFLRIAGMVAENPAVIPDEELKREERLKVLVEFNRTETTGWEDLSICRMFENLVARIPGQTALEWDEEAPGGLDIKQMTYGQLNREANKTARYLTDRGVKKGDIVPVLMLPSAGLLTAVLGILKSGAAFLLMDPAHYPLKRLVSVLRDAAASLLAVDKGAMERLSAETEAEIPRRTSCKLLYWETAAAALSPYPDQNPPDVNTPGDLAYVIYTSGSTGLPKGAALDHRGVCNLGRSGLRGYEPRPGHRVLQFASLNFDASIFEIFTTLLKGAALVLTRRERYQLMRELAEFLETRRINAVALTPTVLRGIPASRLPDLRFLLSAGEKCTPGMVRLWSEGRKFFNSYGPTEDTVCTTMVQFDEPGAGEIPANPTVGGPIDNRKIYILDPGLRPVPLSAPGELCISGNGLARGYLNRPELTAEKFVPNPFLEYGGEEDSPVGRSVYRLMYRTGDLARWLPDGNLEFLGRIDHQVKIRGFRVELEEIERLLTAHPDIRDAAVMAWNRGGDGDSANQSLYAALVLEPTSGAPGGGPSDGDIKAYLSSRLPAYMVPPFIVRLERMPLNSSGKIDRKAIKPPEIGKEAGGTASWTETETETAVAGIWARVLGMDRRQLGKDVNFFDLGGNSLGIINVHNEIRKTFGLEIPAAALFRYTTIADLARHLEQVAGGGLQPEGTAALPARSALSRDRRGLDVAVIGMAARFPGAPELRAFWDNLVNGREGISFFTAEELLEAGETQEMLDTPGYVPAKGVIQEADGFDAAFFGYTQREARVMDPQVRVFHECAWWALEDGGYGSGTYDGGIGLYVGAAPGLNWAMLNRAGGENPDGGFSDDLLMNRDHMATWISYRLNLKGPALFVQTACSTSMVAIHLAANAVANGECGMALAGGVKVSPRPVEGYLYREGMIVSPDGHCRAFDAAAGGTLAGEGAGAVLLKPLEKALQDRDHIYAVITGSALNNDGSQKVGYTAPSVEGQAAVIRAAHRMAGVSAETIGFVEAHGTATDLGDPVELEALKLAFQTPKKGFCAIGSVKSNIGHLDTAAGVAGFIKAALTVSERRIPPSLHFHSPNPRIDFIDTPFYVSSRAETWENEGHPPRAGVSSFGIGGTNAHMVLQEAPAEARRREPSPKDEYHLFVLSARTEKALERLSTGVAAFLKQHPGLDPADVAYTLQVGRKAFKYRRLALCRDLAEAAAAFDADETGTSAVREVQVKDRPAVFRFPGEDAFYVNMGLELYREEPLFREELDRCFRVLDQLPGTGRECKSVLYPDPGEQAGDPGSMARPLSAAFQYALARLLMSWGITPRAAGGRGAGHPIAACISGTLSLEEALERTVSGAAGEEENSTGTTSVPGALTVNLGPRRPGMCPGTVCLLKDAGAGIPGTRHLAAQLGRLWLEGAAPDWGAFNRHKENYRLSLPLYPFERRRFPVDPRAVEALEAKATGATEPGLPVRKPDPADWFYVENWEQSPLPRQREEETPEGTGAGSHCLVFLHPGGVGERLLHHLRREPGAVTAVTPGTGFKKIDDQHFQLAPSRGEHYDTLFEALRRSKRVPDRIFYMWTEDNGLSGLPRPEEADARLDLSYYGPLDIARAVVNAGITANIRILAVTSRMLEVVGGEVSSPWKASILGPVKIIPLEYPHISCRGIDIPPLPENDPGAADRAVMQVLRESRADSPHPVVAFRGNYRWVRGVKPVRLEDHAAPRPPYLREKGVYLITGGMGGMGLSLAGDMARRAQARLILVGRSPFPEPDRWDRWLKEHPGDDPVSGKIRRFRAMEEAGAEVMTASADVSDLTQMEEVVSRARERFGRLHGVLHTAGLADFHGVIQRRSREMCRSVMAPKIHGALVLLHLLEQEALDFMALFSSLGNVAYGTKLGEVSYNAANEFLDALPYYTGTPAGRHVVTINWTDWREMGMSYQARELTGTGNSGPGNRGIHVISVTCGEGVDMYHRILQSGLARVLPSTTDLPELLETINLPSGGKVGRERQHMAETAPLEERPQLTAPYAEPRTDTQKRLAQLWGALFSIEKIGLDDDFYELGGDSLKALTLHVEIMEKLEVRLPQVELFQSPTIRELAETIDTLSGEGGVESIQPAPAREAYPLSPAQERLYILDQVHAGGTAYNMPFAFTWEGELDREGFQRAFRGLVRRHEALRTSFHTEGTQHVQRISETADFHVAFHTNPEEEAEIHIAKLVKPFDLRRPPLLRVEVIPVEEKRHYVFMDIHHIISDGSSMGILLRDFARLYGGKTLAPLSLHYKDYAHWQNQSLQREHLKELERYWLEKLDGMTHTQLPPDRFDDYKNVKGKRERLVIEAPLYQRVEEFCRRENMTKFVFTITIFAALLAEEIEQPDVTVGTPVSVREHPDLKHMLGLFLNVVLIRLDIRKDDTFARLAARSRETVLEALDKKLFPYERISYRMREKDPSRGRELFSILFNYFTIAEEDVLRGDGFDIIPVPVREINPKFDVAFYVSEGDDTFVLAIDYKSNIYNEPTIKSLLHNCRDLMERVLDDESAPLSRLFEGHAAGQPAGERDPGEDFEAYYDEDDDFTFQTGGNEP